MTRIFDFFLAFAGLLVFLPLLIILLAIIRIDSAGSPLFSQIRIGRRACKFTCFKLRTMKLNTGDKPSHEVGKAEITRVGGLLRRYKIDELPQLINVIKGEMSFVGPRPCLPQQTVLIKERQQKGVLELRPGITGWAQIQGIDMSDPVLLAVTDAEYLKVQSLKLYFKLIIATILGRGLGQDAAHLSS